MRTDPMRWFLLVPLTAAAACSGGPADAPDAETSCLGDPRGETFTSGMSKSGDNGITFTIVSADPAPPARSGDSMYNTWTVDISNADGPLAGAMVSLVPFMPDHNHGSGIPPIIAETATPGEYEMSRIDLFMPGIWENTIKAIPSGGSQADLDSVKFTFCIEQ